MHLEVGILYTCIMHTFIKLTQHIFFVAGRMDYQYSRWMVIQTRSIVRTSACWSNCSWIIKPCTTMLNHSSSMYSLRYTLYPENILDVIHSTLRTLHEYTLIMYSLRCTLKLVPTVPSTY